LIVAYLSAVIYQIMINKKPKPMIKLGFEHHYSHSTIKILLR